VATKTITGAILIAVRLCGRCRRGQNWVLDHTKSSPCADHPRHAVILRFPRWSPTPWQGTRKLHSINQVHLRLRRSRLMQRATIAILILASTWAFAEESSLLTSISGLWQFAENNVWIQIDDKGAAYQCRIGREGTVFSGSGRFVSPNSIEWQNIWGTDTVILTSGSLLLKGRCGEFKHHRASTPMSPACLPMRQRGGVTT